MWWGWTDDHEQAARRRLSPEAHLDLHGLNAQQAFETLRGFMRGSWYKGLRTILVVPGRGKNSPDGVGVLRGKLQSWLTQDLQARCPGLLHGPAA